jgi:hypothetical protein
MSKADELIEKYGTQLFDLLTSETVALLMVVKMNDVNVEGLIQKIQRGVF